MSLKVTRTKRRNLSLTSTEASVNSTSVWSARDLFPPDMQAVAKPTFVEHVSPDANGHLGADDIARLFDRLWTNARDRRGIIVELDMADVQSVENRFTRELAFFRRQLRRQRGEVRVTNHD